MLDINRARKVNVGRPRFVVMVGQLLLYTSSRQEKCKKMAEVFRAAGKKNVGVYKYNKMGYHFCGA